MLQACTIASRLLVGARQRLWKVHDPRSSAFFGVGSYTIMRADSYRAVGGHERVALRPDEDLRLGQAVKLSGMRSAFLNGEAVLECPWYHSLGDFVRGLEKNLFAALDYSGLAGDGCHRHAHLARRRTAHPRTAAPGYWTAACRPALCGLPARLLGGGHDRLTGRLLPLVERAPLPACSPRFRLHAVALHVAHHISRCRLGWAAGAAVEAAQGADSGAGLTNRRGLKRFS